MIKSLFLLFAILLVGKTTGFAQTSAVSVTDWPMPSGHTNGLTKPGFKIVPKLVFENIGTQKRLVLKMDVQMGTARNPVAPFSYRYTYHGKEYTDQDLGFDLFTSIQLKSADFTVLVQGPNVNTRVRYETNIGHIEIGFVPKDALLTYYAAHVQGLEDVNYRGVENIEKAIIQLEDNRRKKTQAQTDPKTQTENKTANKPESPVAKPEQGTPKPVMDNSAKGNFWNEKKTVDNSANAGNSKTNTTPPDRAKPADFVSTVDGKYYQKGKDGKFKQITSEEYQNGRDGLGKSITDAPSEKKVTPEEAKASVDKGFADARARDEALTAKINQFSQAWQQNFYYAEAIRNGKQNLAELSTLSGDYNSVEQLKADFNQKYSSIHGQVQELEEARNDRLNNAVNYNLNGNTTERAIGQGVQLIGGIINSAKAKKEEKEAKAALEAARKSQEAEILAAKQKARTDLRNLLLKSFPNGGTPLTAHKISAPQVYLFGYIVDKSLLNSEKAEVTLSNVFPIVQYSDGTFPLKTVVANKLKGLGRGDIVLVGFYADKISADQMRTAFIRMAQQSELGVRTIALKSVGSSNASATSLSQDFWENGKKERQVTDSTKKKDSFWNN